MFADAVSHPDDKTTFKDLVQDVRPLEAGPRIVPAVPRQEDAVQVRVRPGRHMLVSDTDGVILAHASDCSPRVAQDLGTLSHAAHGRTLDLHRMNAAKATAALTAAVSLAQTDGEPILLVVCGKGTHSGPPGPVLKQLVLEQLSGPLADKLMAFRTAPRGLGGEGAFLIRLRRRKPSQPPRR
jgi:DNA-nicking Smr family endonuclease